MALKRRWSAFQLVRQMMDFQEVDSHPRFNLFISLLCSGVSPLPGEDVHQSGQRCQGRNNMHLLFPQVMNRPLSILKAWMDEEHDNRSWIDENNAFLKWQLHFMTVLRQGFHLHKLLRPNVPAPKRPAPYLPNLFNSPILDLTIHYGEQ